MQIKNFFLVSSWLTVNAEPTDTEGWLYFEIDADHFSQGYAQTFRNLESGARL